MSRVREEAKEQLRRWPVVFDTAKRVRDELRATPLYRTAQRRAWCARRGSDVRRYLAEHDVPKLQLGAGWLQRPGWLNTDLAPALPGTIFLDATEPFPFDDATFGYIYSEHMIEHVSYDEACSMLRECLRILRPGGTIRVATPDLAQFTKLYAERHELGPDQAAYVDWIAATFIGQDRGTPAFVINNLFRAWGHQFLFDEETLRSTLLDAGFTDVRRCQVGQSADAHLRDLETHGDQAGSDAANRFETLVLEADRPSTAIRTTAVNGQASSTSTPA